MSAGRVIRDEAYGFLLNELAFGARHKDEGELLFVVEAASEQVARERAEEIAREFFGLKGDALVLVPLDKETTGVPNFLANFFKSSGGGSGGIPNAVVEPRTLH